MSLFELTAFQRDILFIIARLDQPSGQDIKAQFEDETSIEVNRGNVYPNLDTLVEINLIEKDPLDRRANCYSLTEEGISCLKQRHEWEQEQLSNIQKRI